MMNSPHCVEPSSCLQAPSKGGPSGSFLSQAEGGEDREERELVKQGRLTNSTSYSCPMFSSAVLQA